MTYLIKSTPRNSNWAYISGSGNNYFTITQMNVETLFPLQNFTKETNFQATIANSVITLANKRYIFIIKPFYDQIGTVSNPASANMYLKVNNSTILSTGINITSPGTGINTTQTNLAMYEYIATAGDTISLYIVMKNNYGNFDLGIYWNGGATTSGMFGFFIMEIDL